MLIIKFLFSLSLIASVCSGCNNSPPTQYIEAMIQTNEKGEDFITCFPENLNYNRFEKIVYKGKTYWEIYSVSKKSFKEKGINPEQIVNILTNKNSCTVLNKDMTLDRLSYMPEPVAIQFAYRRFKKSLDKCYKKTPRTQCIGLVEKDLRASEIKGPSRLVLFPEDLKALSMLGVNIKGVQPTKSIKDLYKDRIPNASGH